MKILGIETSCDETAAAVIEGPNIETPRLKVGASLRVLSNIVSSQIKIHKKYGGVVPELAAREHVLNILPVIDEALEKAGISVMSLRNKKNSPPPPLYKGGIIDAIAVTTGPGLITSLMVGVETAKVLSYVWKIPLIAVNHIEGHIYANFINKEQGTKNREQNIKFPALILTVSGGHTMLILMRGYGKYKVIGETLDDAAGEAFDKAAAMMGIGYPGGPVISAYAEKFKIQNNKFQINSKIKIQKLKNQSKIENLQSQITLPRPMIYSKDYNFSFSGLKTALLYQLQKNPNFKSQIPNYCHEFQQAVIDVLIHKTIKAAENYKTKTIMLAGGVAANLELRKQMAEAIKNNPAVCGVKFQIPELQYTTDNAAMIAVAGYFKALRKEYTPWQKLKAESDLEL